MKRNDEQTERSRQLLLKYCPKGQTVYTTVRHVAQSGMSRNIDLYTVFEGRIVWLTGLAANLLGKRIAKNGGIVMKGCGTDMGFETVYLLAMALYCPDKYDHGAAYALKQERL